MPVLCDFTVIQDGNVTIGDNGPDFSKTFSTGGRHDSQALLMLNVTGLTDGSAIVKINNKFQKTIQPCADSSQWLSQHMVLPSDLLSPNDNQNEIVIQRVDETANGSGNFDDFIVRDIVVFFHQSA